MGKGWRYPCLWGSGFWTICRTTQSLFLLSMWVWTVWDRDVRLMPWLPAPWPWLSPACWCGPGSCCPLGHLPSVCGSEQSMIKEENINSVLNYLDFHWKKKKICASLTKSSCVTICSLSMMHRFFFFHQLINSVLNYLDFIEFLCIIDKEQIVPQLLL